MDKKDKLERILKKWKDLSHHRLSRADLGENNMRKVFQRQNGDVLGMVHSGTGILGQRISTPSALPFHATTLLSSVYTPPVPFNMAHSFLVWRLRMEIPILSTKQYMREEEEISILSTKQYMREEDLFKYYLPSEIITEILSRLSVRTIAISKCVGKSWLDLLKSDEFLNFYLYRSADALHLLKWDEKSSQMQCTVFQLEDEIELTKFEFPHKIRIEGSANGMLLLVKGDERAEALYVCNPMSREYIKLRLRYSYPEAATYGFGTSKISGEHKVVHISKFSGHHSVYTLGKGSWRRVEADRASYRYHSTSGALVNGNLHWLALDSNDNQLISCFDLETECFSTFRGSPFLSISCIEKVYALRDCLCLCDHTSKGKRKATIIIWLMKDYGVEKSWTKEYVINLGFKFRGFSYDFVSPIKVYQNGDIMFIRGSVHLYYYSNKTKTTRMLARHGDISRRSSRLFIYPVLLAPSFFSLKSFGTEKVELLKCI